MYSWFPIVEMMCYFVVYSWFTDMSCISHVLCVVVIILPFFLRSWIHTEYDFIPDLYANCKNLNGFRFRSTLVHPRFSVGSVFLILVFFCIVLCRPLYVFYIVRFCHCIVCPSSKFAACVSHTEYGHTFGKEEYNIDISIASFQRIVFL